MLVEYPASLMAHGTLGRTTDCSSGENAPHPFFMLSRRHVRTTNKAISLVANLPLNPSGEMSVIHFGKYR